MAGQSSSVRAERVSSGQSVLFVSGLQLGARDRLIDVPMRGWTRDNTSKREMVMGILRSNGVATKEEEMATAAACQEGAPQKIKDEAKKNGNQKGSTLATEDERESARRERCQRQEEDNRKEGGVATRIANPGGLRDQVAKYFSASPPKKGEATLRARCKPGLAGLRVSRAPWSLISWFLHVNFLPPNQRCPRAAPTPPRGCVRSAPQGNPGPRISSFTACSRFSTDSTAFHHCVWRERQRGAC